MATRQEVAALEARQDEEMEAVFVRLTKLLAAIEPALDEATIRAIGGLMGDAARLEVQHANEKLRQRLEVAAGTEAIVVVWPDPGLCPAEPHAHIIFPIENHPIELPGKPTLVQ